MLRNKLRLGVLVPMHYDRKVYGGSAVKPAFPSPKTNNHLISLDIIAVYVENHTKDVCRFRL
jgi:hypothetical protein